MFYKYVLQICFTNMFYKFIFYFKFLKLNNIVIIILNKYFIILYKIIYNYPNKKYIIYGY